MVFSKTLVAVGSALFIALQTTVGQAAPTETDIQLKRAIEQIERLANKVAAQDARIQELEAQRGDMRTVSSTNNVRIVPAVTTSGMTMPMTPAEPAAKPADPAPPAAPVDPILPPQADPDSGGTHDHMLQMPGGGPALKIRGFYDLNFGTGTNSNPLAFPIVSQGRSTFQTGEFDLVLSSKLTDKLSFVSELVIGSNKSNDWGLDIERVQLTYKASKYFEISGGRYHTAIGYYNTSFHHGTWFQTATGRPFMYYFEDSGGLLPVHGVGVTTTGLVPGTGSPWGCTGSPR